MGKKLLGPALSNMSDKEIEQKLAGKQVKIKDENDNILGQGEVINFFNHATSDLPEKRIAGVILRSGKEITFTDDINIEIENE